MRYRILQADCCEYKWIKILILTHCVEIFFKSSKGTYLLHFIHTTKKWIHSSKRWKKRKIVTTWKFIPGGIGDGPWKTSFEALVQSSRIIRPRESTRISWVGITDLVSNPKMLHESFRDDRIRSVLETAEVADWVTIALILESRVLTEIRLESTIFVNDRCAITLCASQIWFICWWHDPYVVCVYIRV